METQIRHILSMQYSPAEMGLMAIEDILEGPERMHRDVLHRLPELNKMRKEYTDSQAKPELDQFPGARRSKPPRRGKVPGAPKSKIGFMKTFAASVVRQGLPVRELSRKYPEANVAHLDLKWWLLAQYDSAVVSSADGTSASWYKRDRDQARDLAKRSLALHARLAKEWPALSKQYKDALADLVSPKTWAESFEESTKPRS
jgi:galactofuranosylgalactofuranosylrhamnosyl-N-acetylglucosaminyl-diphospho-decaprenol beta-1,5/1,6-galactofuranosyltransferase